MGFLVFIQNTRSTLLALKHHSVADQWQCGVLATETLCSNNLL